MAKFIELTEYHSGKPIFVNIERIEDVCTNEISQGDGDYLSVKESYEQIKDKILFALGEKKIIVSNETTEEVLEKLKEESDCICKENEELALELDRLKTEEQRRKMDIESEKSIFHKAILKYGVSSQVGMAMEELAELIQALNKSMRDEPNNVPEEIADVEIMLEQLKLIFSCKNDVEKIRKDKVKRLEGRLTKERGKKENE